LKLLQEFIGNDLLLENVHNASFSYLVKNHTAAAVNSNFID